MLENFKQYLIDQGYSEFTPSGTPSTVYDYMGRVERICDREGITIKNLADNISVYVDKYGPTGNEVDFGRKSHNAYISALKKFENFVR